MIAIAGVGVALLAVLVTHSSAEVLDGRPRRRVPAQGRTGPREVDGQACVVHSIDPETR